MIGPNSEAASMKLNRGSSVIFVLLLACGSIAIADMWERAHTIYATPETESAFLKNYTPKRVIEQFEDEAGLSLLNHNGGGAGSKFATHTAGFEVYFALRSEKWTPVMNALRDDVATQLAADGAQILSQSGDAHTGFHFDYKIGQKHGLADHLPLATTNLIHRVTPLPEGTADVTARIEFTEKWFPKVPKS
jgi:hypothetical protein